MDYANASIGGRNELLMSNHFDSEPIILVQMLMIWENHIKISSFKYKILSTTNFFLSKNLNPI